MAKALRVQGMGGLELKVNHRGSFFGIHHGREEVVVSYRSDGKVFNRVPVGDNYRRLGVFPKQGDAVGLESFPGIVRLNVVLAGVTEEDPVIIVYCNVNTGLLMTEGDFDKYQAARVPR